MITKLKIKFLHDPEIRPSAVLAPLFQGILMEKIPEEYAVSMHTSSLHPYSQYISSEDGAVVWNVTALDNSAKFNITDVLLNDSFTSAEIRHKGTTLYISEKSVEHIKYSDLLDKYYIRGESSRYITFEFITQTSFKSNGKYVIMPASELILNSLVRKFDAVSESLKLYDDSLMDYIKNHTEIVEYNLRSRKFPMEGISIPSFIGSVRIKLSGNPEFISLCNMLLDFAQYSGTGIKTAMGMGAGIITNTGGVI